MNIYLSELAQFKLLRLSDYLIEEWDLKTRDKFIEILNKQISLQPQSCPVSDEFPGLYKCVITKQTTFYYRKLSQFSEIEIIAIFDTRQDPDKLQTDLE